MVAVAQIVIAVDDLLKGLVRAVERKAGLMKVAAGHLSLQPVEHAHFASSCPGAGAHRQLQGVQQVRVDVLGEQASLDYREPKAAKAEH
jgi:hypothetical protein